MNNFPEVKAGCAETVFEVPLFNELSGYGPWKGRRNLGVRDPLFCRALTLNDGSRRAVIVVTDMLMSNKLDCRIMRIKLASEFALLPQDIMFVATHSHSSPGKCYPGYGEMTEECRNNWFHAVRSSVATAVKNEEKVQAFVGKSKIRKKLGQNRADEKGGPTDPEIRWVKFVRSDGTTKVLLHNHAMHGVVFGSQQKLVSADWMGDANRKIKERKLADIPFFLYGCAGDINVIWTHKSEERDKNLDWISESYVNDLEAGLNDCEEISLSPVCAKLEAFELPTEAIDSKELRRRAESLRQKASSSEFATLLQYTFDRMIEMAILAEKGNSFQVIEDLQTIRAGDLQIYAIPGEPFLAVGEKLMIQSDVSFPLAVSVANGSAGYLPTPEMFKNFPTYDCCDDWGAYGFYEVWFTYGNLQPKFKPEIEDFVTRNLLSLGKLNRI